MAYQITALCNGCTVCAELCPVSAIHGEKKSRHQVNPVRCIDCGVCGRACPQEAVLNGEGQMVNRLPRKQWPKPVVNRDLCSACSMCVEICGKHALSISLPTSKTDLQVYAFLSHPKACVGCEQCAQICPLQAIIMEVPS